MFNASDAEAEALQPGRHGAPHDGWQWRGGGDLEPRKSGCHLRGDARARSRPLQPGGPPPDSRRFSLPPLLAHLGFPGPSLLAAAALRCAGYCPGERLPCRGPRAPRCPPGRFGVTRCLPAWRVRSAPDGRRRPQSCLETWAPPLVRLRVRVLPRRDPPPSSRPPLASLRGARLRVPPTPPGQRSCRASLFESSSILARGPGRWGGAVSPP